MKDFSRTTQIYMLGTITMAAVFAAWQFDETPATGTWLLLSACLVASFLQGIAVFGATARSSYSLSWIVYAFTFTLVGPTATLIVVFISHLVEWFLDRDRLKWYIQVFNISSFFIGFVVAGRIVSWGAMDFAPTTAYHILLTLSGLAVFTLINHLLVAWVVKLARGQSFSESGIFGSFTLLLDFTLLCLGFSAAILWQANPAAILLVVFISYILFQALNIPALERKAEIDAKTELFNARYFTQALDEEMVRSKRFKRPLSLIMADLDFLRDINNTYGHLAGDVVLQGVAQIMQDATRDLDVVSRFGGEEFAIMLPETAVEDAVIVAERVRQRIQATEFTIATSIEPIHATMSFGVAGFEDKRQSTEELIHNADVALYRAKETGRNRVLAYDHQVDAATESERDWDMLSLAVKSKSKPTGVINANGQHSAAPSPPIPPPTTPTAASSRKDAPTHKQHRCFPHWAIYVYITIFTLLTLGFGIFLSSQTTAASDLTGLMYFAIVAILMEAAAIEIYVRDSSVSTSVALLVAGVILFGVPAAICLGIVTAFVAYAKRRTFINRFIFNASNHTFGGLIIAGLLMLQPNPVDTWSLPYLLFFGVGSTGLVYLSTTLLLTGALRLTSSRLFKEIWNERFRWLAPYYLALGVIAAMLIVSYQAIALTGLLVIMVPLLMMRYSQKQYIDQTEKLVQGLKESNQQLIYKSDEINLLNEELLLTLARSIDLRDPYVVEHSKYVSRYAVYLAEELGLTSDQIEIIRKAGLLHDIGKLGVREEILFKPTWLTADEYEQVKEHSIIGADLVRGCHTLISLAPYILHHHEWFDGSGYPHGLAGEEIPLEARILCVADAVEAMASDRPYKKAMSPTDILAEVSRCAGSQFDPAVAAALGRVISRHGEGIIVNTARNVMARNKNVDNTYEPHY